MPSTAAPRCPRRRPRWVTAISPPHQAPGTRDRLFPGSELHPHARQLVLFRTARLLSPIAAIKPALPSISLVVERELMVARLSKLTHHARCVRPQRARIQSDCHRFLWAAHKDVGEVADTPIALTSKV